MGFLCAMASLLSHLTFIVDKCMMGLQTQGVKKQMILQKKTNNSNRNVGNIFETPRRSVLSKFWSYDQLFTSPTCLPRYSSVELDVCVNG
jgi:hypothetical protein